jgi:phosphoenolpyruvate carboxykinase (GTP)
MTAPTSVPHPPLPHVAAGAAANDHVRRFVHQALKRCVPDRIYWCNGSPFERRKLAEQAIEEGVIAELRPRALHGCYLHVNDHGDAARGGPCMLVCLPNPEDAAPNDDWMDPAAAYDRMHEFFDRSMIGRTMYVIPFLTGAPSDPAAAVGVQITDSLYVALRMTTTTRVGDAALHHLGDGHDFVRCLHSLGDGDPLHCYACFFPQDNTIYSFGSVHRLGQEELFL